MLFVGQGGGQLSVTNLKLTIKSALPSPTHAVEKSNVEITSKAPDKKRFY